MHYWDIISNWLIVFNFIFALVVVFLERRNAAVTWAWLMLLLFIPIFGFIFYILLGQNLARHKVYKIKPSAMRLAQEGLNKQINLLKSDEFQYRRPEVKNYQHLIYMNLINCFAPLSQDNDVRIITDGREKMDLLIEQIGKAKSHVHLLYYKVASDETGRKLIAALTDKAREGLVVRLLYDDIGSPKLEKKALQDLIAAGGEVHSFFPSRIRFLNLRVNYRNHRKIAVIDGEVGFVGGFNIGNEYLGLDPAIGFWRDTHLMLKGEAVHRLQLQFMLDWSIAANEHPAYDKTYFPDIQSQGSTAVQIVSGGPDSDKQQIKNGLIKLIFEAKHRIYLQTPYLVPDDSVLNALKVAIQSGIDVHIMIPLKGDSKLVQWASNAYLAELLREGAKCYFYEKGFLHSKVIVVDNQAASVGTANIDHRSFELNFEVNAFLYDEEFATQLGSIFEQDMLDSQLINWHEYQKRSLFNRFMESVARLMSPIL
ncbi:cardiolipin synthase [Paenibacillus marinisediminis]